jgi:hypothetical protein
MIPEFESIFSQETQSDIYNKMLKGQEAPEIEVLTNFEINHFTKYINCLDLFNLLDSKFTCIGTTLSNEKGGTKTFSLSPAVVSSIHIARVDKDNKIVTKLHEVKGILIPIMDEYNSLQLPAYDPAIGPDMGMQYNFGKTNTAKSGIYQTQEAIKSNRASINPTNIYPTKLNFRQLGMQNCGFNVQEFVYVSYQVSKKEHIGLNVAVRYNWETKILEVTPEGLNYINEKLLRRGLAENNFATQEDVNITTAMRQAEDMIMDVDKQKAFKADLAAFAKERAKLYSGQSSLDDIVEYDEEEDNDELIKPVRKTIVKTKVKVLAPEKIKLMNKLFAEGVSVLHVSKEAKVAYPTATKYFKIYQKQNTESVVEVVVNSQP